ncbi:MAG: prepilin peptidase [Pseudanabaenaceae cyanobacterium]
MEPIAFSGLAFVVGACLGSFANVVVYRLPAGLSLWHPPSRCPQCLTPLAPTDNVPILGWLWLRGRCRYCHAPISWRYPAVELAGGLLCAAVAAFWGLDTSLWLLAARGGFLVWLLVLALIDMDTLLLPDRLTQPGLVCGLLYQVGAAWLTQQNPWVALQQGILSAVVGIWLLPVLTFTVQIGVILADSLGLPVGQLRGQELMGGGDAKLAAAMGPWLGVPALVVAHAIAVVAGVLGNLGQVGRGQPVPFGPFLAIGGGIALFYGEAIAQGYSDWFGLN